jgi:coenzyme F420-0:L-glutamate ligase/coenzyme F420-1:gamma-L-glutamate ligase
MKKIEVMGLETIPKIQAGDDLPKIIFNCAENEIGGFREKDIIVITSKIVSKALGRFRKLDDVKPGRKALAISAKTGKNAKWLQMIFDEGHNILAIMPLKGVIEKHIYNATGETEDCTKNLIQHEQALCITVGKEGRIHTCDAGIDGSNNPAGIVTLLPEDPDLAAKEIRETIRTLAGKEIAVILADTEIYPFGTMDLAVGSSGIEPVTKMFGKKDLYGRAKFGGIDLTAHELTAAATLVFGQLNAGIAAAVIRGCDYKVSETENIANTLILQTDEKGASEMIKSTLKATSYACGLKKRLLLKIASWFI